MGKILAIKPLVSVALRTYNNRGQFLSEAIKSIQSQTYENLEIIILNDGSTDDTDEIARQHTKLDKRIVYLKNEQEQSFAGALNQILRQATGRYIAFLNGDDYWLDLSKLAKQVGFLETHSDCAVVGGSSLDIEADGTHRYSNIYFNTDLKIRDNIFQTNQFAYGSVMTRLALVREVGGFNEKLPTASDLDLWLKLGRCGRYYNFKQFWLARRMHGSNTGETKRQQQIKENIDIIKNYRRLFPNYFMAAVKLHLQYFAFFLSPSLIKLIRLARQKYNNFHFSNLMPRRETNMALNRKLSRI